MHIRIRAGFVVSIGRFYPNIPLRCVILLHQQSTRCIASITRFPEELKIYGTASASDHLHLVHQSGPAGFSAGGCVAFDLSGVGVPVSYSGVIFCIISVGTVFSSLQSDRMTRRFGAGGVTAISVAMTAAALFGFSVSSSFWAMCLWAIPYGLGAGSVDAALNNYVALHFASRHMSWLHCMWGIGASVGPYIMGAALSSRAGWQTGYRVISVMQMVLTIIILLSLPLWKTKSGANAEEREAAPAEALTLKQIFRISGVKEVLVTFFCYCSLEQTTSLWASSYLVLNRGIAPETAAGFASLFLSASPWTGVVRLPDLKIR